MWKKTWTDLLRDVLENGCHVKREDSSRCNTELVSHKFTIDDPRNRLIYSKTKPTNIFQCVGQFLWITQGNFNLDAISYYQSHAEKYSSDGIKVIGAYGPRLFGIAHMNQIEYILDTLDKDPEKRKAVASIYLPHFDHHGLPREEIPCTLNLQYLIRNEQLLALTYMRSQDAFNVLPYDVFNFTMLQEYVQNRLVPKHNPGLGSYHHHSGSFHVYENSKSTIQNMLSDPDADDIVMPPMPHKDVRIRLKDMNAFESIVRTNVVAKLKYDTDMNFESMFEMAKEKLCDKYWQQIGYLLLFYGARKLKSDKYQDKARGQLQDPYGKLVDIWVSNAQSEC